jgi:hypothetical protein
LLAAGPAVVEVSRPHAHKLVAARRPSGQAAERTPQCGPGRASVRLGVDWQIVRVYDGLVAMTEEELAVLISQTPRPPMLTLALPDEQVPAALLVWARSQGDWRAGVCYLHRTWYCQALVTTWAPAVRVSPSPAVDYRRVPRVQLPGDPSQWPALPPAYPGADTQWMVAHQHLVFGDNPR